MKKIFITIPMLLGAVLAHAQWTPINSTTTQTLNDVDFKNDSYGVIVGNRETILLTSNGGSTWTDINNGIVRGDILNVKVWNTDTILVSSFDLPGTTGIVFLTTDGGSSWNALADDFALIHRADIETNGPQGRIFTSLGRLVSTDINLSSWDTALTGISGTTSADLLRFADTQVGSLSGNVSGAMTYSTRFFRTEDAGVNWYPGDPFSMPNSDAHTTMNFANVDTAYVFTNQYSNWAPSSVNRLVRISNFNLSIPSPGDTVYTYNSQIVNNNMPDYMNDARFEDTQNGLALGNMGSVYRTVNGGTTWTVDYTDACSTCSLNKMDFENGVGYAVGANGILIKYSLQTSIDSHENENALVNIYPNPNNGIVKMSLNSDEIAVAELYDVVGEKLKHIEFKNNTMLDLTENSSGIYFIRTTVKGKSVTKKIIIQ
ncbi:MAG: T9SS type A sorting domain-containing protein [Bacteroidetes bacterium]|nr:T9SS type A sorting domain-containing protein [Bacteroidota bacterium]